MTVAQATVKESLCRRILDLSDEEIGLVERYVSDLEGHEPNEETIKAIEESYNPANLIECDDIQDMFRKCGIKCGAEFLPFGGAKLQKTDSK